MIAVIALDQVVDDSTGLPEREISVRVVDSGHATIGIDGEELWLLQICEADGYEFVGDVEFV